jgi:RNA recognition motif-containing protein
MATRLYVGGLPYSTTEEDLRAAFEPAGNITSLTIVTDRYSGQSRGFGFVEMATNEEAQNAIRMLNGSTLGGRTLTVNEAREREQGGGPRRSPGGGGGRSGGYGGGGGGGRRW